jgi:hypothetical protein
MKLFRISFTTTTGHHVEEKPFIDLEDAHQYTVKEGMATGSLHWGCVEIGECIVYKVEVTDTYGGEANYSWVRRYEFHVPLGTTTREIVRRAKALASWTGHRCETSDYGDQIDVRPRGMAQVMFISFVDR